MTGDDATWVAGVHYKLPSQRRELTMPILDQWDLRLDADAVLRGQGADPAILRSRRPNLFEIANQALDQALPIIHPQVMYERFPVEAIQHARVRLGIGNELKGAALTQHLVQRRKYWRCFVPSGLISKSVPPWLWKRIWFTD